MHFEKYYRRIIRYDLINKFHYSKLKKVPKIEIVNLNFSSNNFEIKNLARTLLALNFLAGKRGKFLLSSKLSSKFTTEIGCKVGLKKRSMYNFFTKFVLNILHSLKTKKIIRLTNRPLLKNIVVNFKTQYIFKELEKNYEIFQSSTKFNVTVTTNTKLTKELKYLLNSFQFLSKKR